jgi:dipeptidyl aminopeptidase/acylaminoacyl peptidase
MAIVRRTLIAGLGVIGLTACDGGFAADLSDLAQTWPHPDRPDATIEFYYATSLLAGPRPLIVCLHGHQSPTSSLGGGVFVKWGELQRLTELGFAVVAVSLPGFGGSTGPADFAGPFTQNAVAAIIRHLQQTGRAAPDKTIIQGISLGALTAALLAARSENIQGLVLISGAYDLAALFANKSLTGNAEVMTQVQIQTGGGVAALDARSALKAASNIKAKTLILNGARDDRTDPTQAIQLQDAIRRAGGTAETVIYPEFGHLIPFKARQDRVDQFLKQFL